ncbi:MAG: hypothetical protein P8X63_02380 [Desulfuromonadaceae bacterium]
MSENEPRQGPENGAEDTTETLCRFPELAEIQNEIAKRIRDNQRFLDRFMDEDFVDEAEATDEDDEEPEEL